MSELAPTMPRRIDLRTASDPGDGLQQAAERIASGGTVRLPTELGYMPFRRAESAVAGDVLVFGNPVAAFDFFPNLGRGGLRLLHRVWPGALTMSVSAPESAEIDGIAPLWGALTDGTRSVFGGGPVALWCPGHPVPREVGRYLPMPLAASLSGPQKLADAGAGEDDLVVDDGPIERITRPTRLAWSGTEWAEVESGAIAVADIEKCLAIGVLFVCTGNTCRSPLAEGVFRKKLAAKLDCEPAGLPARGVTVGSAGVAARYGAPASPESKALSDRHGYGLESHASQGLTGELLDRVDHVFTMTRRHRDMILDARPDLSDRVELLARDGGDVADPIGGGPEEYEACHRQIAGEIDAILDGWGTRYGTEGTR